MNMYCLQHIGYKDTGVTEHVSTGIFWNLRQLSNVN